MYGWPLICGVHSELLVFGSIIKIEFTQLGNYSTYRSIDSVNWDVWNETAKILVSELLLNGPGSMGKVGYVE